MAIDAHLKEPGSGITAAFRHRGMGSGPIVFTDDAREYTASPQPFLNDTYGANLNQNVAFGGTPVRVHDGIDSVLWTGANVTGTAATFNSTTQAYAGSQSTEWFNPTVGSIIAYNQGGGGVAVNSYKALTMRVYISTTWGAGDEFEVYLYDTGTTSTIGTPVSLRDYLTVGTTGSWQLADIPLEDFMATGQTFDAIRIEVTAAAGSRPTLYFDEIIIQETGGATWQLDLSADYSYIVDLLRFTVAGPRANIKNPSRLFGLTLSNGINYQRVTDGVTAFSATILNLSDLCHLGFIAVEEFDDGATNDLFMFEARPPYPLTLKRDGDGNDNISLSLSEDFSSLTFFKALAFCRREPLADGAIK